MMKVGELKHVDVYHEPCRPSHQLVMFLPTFVVANPV